MKPQKQANKVEERNEKIKVLHLTYCLVQGKYLQAMLFVS